MLPLSGCAAFAMVLASDPAVSEGGEAVRFDPQRKVGTATDAVGKQITCTIYADLVVCESDTDTPDPEETALIPLLVGMASDCAFPVRLAWTGRLSVEAAGPVQCRQTP